ncbi:MAG: PspC domain-containing protein [Actinomycetota bacterium]
MTTQRSSLATKRPALLPRSATSHVLTGVAGGIAERLGVDPAVVRAAFIALSCAGGFGVMAYVVLWILSAEPTRSATARPLLDGPRQVAAIGFITAGLLILLRSTGLWLGDGVVWPVTLAAFGVSVIWVQGEGPSRRDRMLRGSADASAFSGRTLVRVGIGALLIFAGMGSLLAANMTFTIGRLLDLGLPVAVAVAGLSLIFGPWLFRLAQQAAEERRERIRSQERSELAAHLHDSVLQTLALIQRADSTRETAMLARVQERELRSWLYGRAASSNGQTLAAAVEAAAGRIEETLRCNVETVIVGDMPLDDKARALVGACSEAMTNAAKHSGDSAIAVYLEVEPDEVVAYVRDQGRGFNADAIPEDRRGIADSIVGRMKAHGGVATITTARRQGTEIQLRMPR